MAQGSSTIVSGLRGSVGGITFVRTRTGVAVRQRSKPRNPDTPAQQETRKRMTRVSQAWKAMTLAQSEAWALYAQTLAAPDPVTGLMTSPRPHLVFTRLAMKVLQSQPWAEIPLDPPTGVFGGDSVGMAVFGEPGFVRFSSYGMNQEGVVSELLLQRLDSIHCRAYPDKYRSHLFIELRPENDYDIACPPGVYACAVRYVELASGRETGLVYLGRVVVAA